MDLTPFDALRCPGFRRVSIWRHNYVRKVAETAVQLFISNDKPNISGMILAGSADFKTELSQSDMFDPRLQAKIIKLVDVSYGGKLCREN